MDRERERAGGRGGGGGGGEHENPGRRRVGWRRRTQSDLVEGNAERLKRKQQKRERQRVRHPQILIGPPTKKITFFKTPPSTAGVTLFPKKDMPPVAKVVP